MAKAVILIIINLTLNQFKGIHLSLIEHSSKWPFLTLDYHTKDIFPNLLVLHFQRDGKLLKQGWCRHAKHLSTQPLSLSSFTIMEVHKVA